MCSIYKNLEYFCNHNKIFKYLFQRYSMVQNNQILPCMIKIIFHLNGNIVKMYGKDKYEGSNNLDNYSFV